MAPAMNHHHPPHQSRPDSFSSFDVHRRPSPPPLDSSYGYFSPQYLLYSRQSAAENAASWHLNQMQESIRHPYHRCQILPADETMLLNLPEKRLCFHHDQPPSRMERRRNHTTNGFSNRHSVLEEDETLILDLPDQNVSDDQYFSLRANGLLEETIVKHMKTRDARVEDDDEMCVVCQVNLLQENQRIATLNCGHEHHAECIKKWLNVKNNCPICKATGLIID